MNYGKHRILLLTVTAGFAVALGVIVNQSSGWEPQQTEEDGKAKNIRLPYDRSLTRAIAKAKSFVEKGQFVEAVAGLGAILEKNQDWFLRPEGDRTNYLGMRHEARRLISELPDEGREAYQLRFGTPAKKMLADAVRLGDVKALAEVSRRFFHTDAGYESMLLLGNYHLDHGRPLAAAVAYQQLLDLPLAAERFEPMLSIQAASCWMRAGMNSRAADVLKALKKSRPNATIQVGNRSVNLFDEDADPLAWMKREIGTPPVASAFLANSWTTFRGDGARNAESRGGMPLLAPRWRVRTVNDPVVEDIVANMDKGHRDFGVASPPALHPLAVGDLVLMRSAQQLFAVDLATGRLVWEMKPDREDPFETMFTFCRSGAQDVQARELASILETRMWEDSAYGTISSDGERVYALQNLPILAARNDGNTDQQASPLTGNRLSALDLQSEGKLVWEVGGPDSEAEELAYAYFLGAPLPMDGLLYVLAEMNGAIHLVVLEAKSGRLEWSQPLADVEYNVLQDPYRRLAGATPSASDGVIVCPTSAGAVIAVDPLGRSLMWASEYTQRPQAMNQGGGIVGLRAAQGQQAERWLDASATIADGCVVVTPIESDMIYCLNLLNGETLWKQFRGENLYVACVYEGKVILVGKNHVSAFQLEDGKHAWEGGATPLPNEAMPSGRGFRSGKYYHLPLSTAEVVKIDLESGEIIERAESQDGHVPGNLICYRGDVLSQGADYLQSYYQIDTLRDRVHKTLKDSPDDAEALARLGEIELAEGRLDKAVELFKRSYAANPADLTRELLIKSLFEGLRTDFETFRSSIPQLESLVDLPEHRISLLRLRATGLQAAGEIMPAFECYLELIELHDDYDVELDEIEPTRSVRRDRWIQSQLAALARAASPEDRAKMEAAIGKRLLGTDKETSIPRLRKFVELLGDQFQAEEFREQLAAKLLETDSRLECEALLLQLARSEKPEVRRRAIARMAKLLYSAGQLEHAAQFYSRLNSEFADQVCLDGQTGEQLFTALPADDPVRKFVSQGPIFPVGEATAKTASGGNEWNQDVYIFVRSDHDQELFQFDTRIVRSEQRQTITGVDGLGVRRFSIPFSPPNYQQHGGVTGPTQGAVNGHLLVLAMGGHVLAVDTLNTRNGAGGWRNILWKQDLNQSELGRPQTFVQPRPYPEGQGWPCDALGPVSTLGVVFQRNRELHSVNPLTGQTMWIRRNIPEACHLFGDDELLFVVAPNATEAMVLNPCDGAQLGTCALPKESERVVAAGRNVLVLDDDGDAMKLSLTDPWNKRAVWSHKVEVGAKTAHLDREEIGVLEPSGRFRIFSIRDGKLLVDQQLEAEPALTGIYLTRSQGQYLLFTNRLPVNNQWMNQGYGNSVFNNPAFTGNVYAFNSQSGKPIWSGPASTENHVLPMNQPRDLPILVLVKQGAQVQNNRQNANKMSVICLDKRSGCPVYQNDDVPALGGDLAISGDRNKKSVEFTTSGVRITITFSEKPVPPSPPMQAEDLSANEVQGQLVPHARRAIGVARLDDSIFPSFTGIWG